MKKRYESFEEIEQDIREGRLVDGLEGETMELENVTDEANEAMNVKVDPTNPDHYKNSTSLECIEAMEIIFGVSAVIDFCVCNAWKYIWRWKNKNGFEDLDKAKWYIDKAWDLFDENFMISEKKNILIRMGAYIEDIERDKKNEN